MAEKPLYQHFSGDRVDGELIDCMSLYQEELGLRLWINGKPVYYFSLVTPFKLKKKPIDGTGWAESLFDEMEPSDLRMARGWLERHPEFSKP